MPQSFTEILYIFFIYAVLGWIVEVIYSAYDDRMFVNRGFLGGPLCPIYGFGVLGVSIILNPLKDNLPLLFIGSVALATILELVVGWILERFFNQRWWDYSRRKFNFRGYICLSFSLIWGIALTAVIWLVHPFVLSLIRQIPHSWSCWILSILSVAIFFDILYTAAALWNLEKKLIVIDEVEAILKRISDSIGGDLYDTAASAISIGEKINQYRKDLLDTVEKNKKVFNRFTGVQLRWLKNYPSIGKGKHKIDKTKILGYLDSVKTRIEEFKEQHK